MSSTPKGRRTTMRKIGFIGLGIMGGPMAANLVEAGHEVAGYNRSRAKVDQLVADGGTAAASVAEAVAGADVVFTMLPDSPDVEAVVLGENGVLAHAERGALLVDCSTIRPDTARRVAETAAERGLRALDAPVSGGEPKAIDGTLSIMVGGAADAFAAAEEVLGAVGATIVHVGPAGAGQTVKAANQLIVAGNIGLLAEALVFLEAHGVDTEAGLDVLGGGLAGSSVLNAKGAKMRNREFDPGFRLELHHKDMGIVQAAVREAGLTAPLGTLVAQLVAAAVAQGDGALDHSALLKQITLLNGRS
ncbi:2-hydroxy-3-oxopropionate reductase [Saccharopolyspora sp. NFXS83]|uniref:2-hydroxy-3-oxopropionate reductase n=1 Tax=Saccharopolyspora sp. NFXS83 TaxID=2993560 RepID=UPI00224B2268|nr:2-hydroxy-3-oxopropionate reductase [Saccharopolyspora sp. NFXS83]MCX2730692.1 2-hydroxy-3-oxopropionate reductase [Saccharopolyspora sp. NFXS83]